MVSKNKESKPVSPLISSSSVYDTYNIIQAYEASTDTELESYRRSGRVQNSNFQISIQKITAANGIVTTVTLIILRILTLLFYQFFTEK